MASKKIFNDFVEYWYYTRSLSKKQRARIFDSLPEDQKFKLSKSYTDGLWEDVFSRNAINDKLDEVKKDFGYDLLSLKAKIYAGHGVYMPAKDWEVIIDQFRNYDPRHLYFVFGGLKSVVCRKNKDVVLIIKVEDQDEDEN